MPAIECMELVLVLDHPRDRRTEALKGLEPGAFPATVSAVRVAVVNVPPVVGPQQDIPDRVDPVTANLPGPKAVLSSRDRERVRGDPPADEAPDALPRTLHTHESNDTGGRRHQARAVVHIRAVVSLVFRSALASLEESGQARCDLGQLRVDVDE